MINFCPDKNPESALFDNFLSVFDKKVAHFGVKIIGSFPCHCLSLVAIPSHQVFPEMLRVVVSLLCNSFTFVQPRQCFSLNRNPGSSPD